MLPRIYTITIAAAWYKKLDGMPVGTRLVTFHTIEDKIPGGYHLIEEHAGKLLNAG